ncbi:histidine phosphatase family protein [Shimwellia pseudoproteus]|uniref:histidine phosphatase family protein n=1 Tax=Shimwellia pseudoproteus TaxID=570012 RepID=UPI0018EAAF47|nr:histidine phosphatase family protein [Shimwellia pseudoproteus]MBJ3815625.1 histidine phosphatase family protein [Shimwellia pseudoproteus]
MHKIITRGWLWLSVVFTPLAAAQEVTIYLIRHGQTWFNQTGQVQGWSDSPLTAAGTAQAVAVGKALSGVSFRGAFSSDAGRARATALAILAENQRPPVPALTESADLREWGYGGYEGRDDADLWTPLYRSVNVPFAKDWSTWEAFTQKMTDEQMADAIARNDPTGSAEPYQAITARLKRGLLAVIQQTQARGGGNVLVVSHGSAIPTLLTLFVPDAYRGEAIGNGSLTILNYRDGQYSLGTVGDTHYLQHSQ